MYAVTERVLGMWRFTPHVPVATLVAFVGELKLRPEGQKFVTIKISGRGCDEYVVAFVYGVEETPEVSLRSFFDQMEESLKETFRGHFLGTALFS